MMLSKLALKWASQHQKRTAAAALNMVARLRSEDTVALNIVVLVWSVAQIFATTHKSALQKIVRGLQGQAAQLCRGV